MAVMVPSSSAGARPAEGPLAGVHVLDLARVLAGPYAAMLLGDLGAEVIKVERPGSGDDTRQWGPPFMPTGDGAESTYFLSVNRGKRSVAIDLKDPRERAFVEALVRWADVLVARVGIDTFQATRYLIGGQVPGPSGNHHPTVAPYGVFDAADGPLVIAVGNEDIWRRFAPLVGLEPADRRFATNALRLGNLPQLHRILNEGLAPRSAPASLPPPRAPPA